MKNSGFFEFRGLTPKFERLEVVVGVFCLDDIPKAAPACVMDKQ
jgi:hypothetical protein